MGWGGVEGRGGVVWEVGGKRTQLNHSITALFILLSSTEGLLLLSIGGKDAAKFVMSNLLCSGEYHLFTLFTMFQITVGNRIRYQ